MGEVVMEAGNKLLVADIGGGTSDIVVSEVVEPGCRVKEATMSTGGLCGGTYVDSRFMEFLEHKVGHACLSQCLQKHRNVYGQLMKEWEGAKSFFDRDESITTTMNFPNKLAVAWEKADVKSGHLGSQEYDQLEMSSEEMQSIFDLVVQQNVELIQQQMVEAGGKVRVFAMVGGFSESPYLLCIMKEAFGGTAEIIVCPPNPGSAICQGAVALALTVVSRMYKLTYGFDMTMPFEKGIDPAESFLQTCTESNFDLFNCDDMLQSPRYVTDKRMQKEGKLVMEISGDMELDELRKIEVSLCFRGSSLEVKAQAVKFNAKQIQLPVEVDYLFS